MPSRSSKSTKSSGSASGTRARTCMRQLAGVQITHAGGCAQQPRHGVKRDVAGVRFAERSEHVDTRARRHRGDLAHQTTLADTW